ncbi:MAG: ParB/RepB/Spo0J family partition protein [Candidatus Kapaibacteriota bacterium]
MPQTIKKTNTSIAAKNIKIKNNPLAELTVTKQENVQALEGIRMTEIRYVAPEKLQPNPLNSIFPQESEAYFDELSADIHERGITDPLVAKPDGTLLTGHNRLTIAKRLGLPRVPVRYVQTGIEDETKELEFVIKDNLLRRHLTDGQRIMLYERLYPNFHERRKKAIDYGTSLSRGGGGDAITPPKDMLTVQEIASATGQKPENVKQQLARFYRKNPQALTLSATTRNGNHTANTHGSTEPTTTTTAGQSSAKLYRTFSKHLESIQSTLNHADDATRRSLLKELRQFVKAVSVR